MQVQREEDHLHFLCHRYRWANHSWFKSVHCAKASFVTLYAQNKSTRPSRTNKQPQYLCSTFGHQQRSANYIESHVPIEVRSSIRSKQDLTEMYPECFNSRVGCFEDDTYHITLDLQVPAVVHAPCKVPVEVKDKLWAELHELESRDIIARVTQPTDWLNVLVIRKEKMGDFVYASILKTWTRRSAENAIRSYRRGNNTQVNRCKALQQAQRSKGLLECKIRQKIIFNNLQYAIRQVPLP